MSHYKPYPSYKDSGVEWLGEVPEGWEVKPLFSVASERSESNKGMVEDNLLSLSYGRIVQKDINTTNGLLPESFETYQVVHPGDTIFRLTDLQNDKISLRTGLVKETGIITSAYVAAIPEKIDPVYFNNLLHSYDIQKVFYAMGGGMRQSLKFTDIKRLPIVLPKENEQKNISKYIKSETTRIDTLIAKKTRFISLLKEKRQALITHAVTKGLDPNAKMKDSGVTAVGQIPEHWELKPLMAEMNLKKIVVGKQWEDYPLLSLTRRGIILRDISGNFGKFPESFETYQEVNEDNLVMCLFDIDETPRTVGLSALKGMITGAYSVFAIANKRYREYLYQLFIHLDDVKGMKPYYSGLRKTIRPSRLLGIRFPFPPQEEAQSICNYIDRETTRIDTLIDKTKRSIDLLKERRSALITAAVTGKIDVRGEAA